MGQVACREDPFCQGDTVVGQKNQFQPVSHAGIAIDDPGHIIGQANDQLGHEISRRRLAAQKYRPGNKSLVGLILDSKISGRHPQDVQQLPFVFMDPFDLHVEHGRCIHLYPQILADIIRQHQFVHLLGRLPGFLKRFIF